MSTRLAEPSAEALEQARRRLVFALDYPSLAQAREQATRVAPSIGIVKVGLELFVREGPAATSVGTALGLDVFLDLKLHDIPETVGRAVAGVVDMGARFLTVHAAGGAAMLERAVQQAARGKLTLLAVTMLTSLDAADLAAQHIQAAPADHALGLARLAWNTGVRGFVTSPDEAAAFRQAFGPEALLVTPGIRPAGSHAADQKRIATPARAIANGADLLVVGRPIRDAADPLDAARQVVADIARATAHPG